MDSSIKIMHNLEHTFGEQRVSILEREKNIRRVFQLVAHRYDLMNDFMSFGSHRIWKRVFVQHIQFKPCELIVDLAGGTGDIARRLIKRGANVVVVDPSLEMMNAGKKIDQNDLDNIAAVAEQLPFADASIDKVTISFGIRNTTSMCTVLSEIKRILKPGGQFYCLEFSEVMMPVRPFYNLYNKYVIPRLGAWVAGQSEAYQYLIESIRKFPNQEEMTQILENSGFKNVTYRNLFFGIACIHSGTNE